MKNKSMKRCVTAATAAAAVFAFSSCDEDVAGIAPSAVVEKDGINLVSGGGKSAHFDAVASHLHLGGEVFGYVDIDGDIENLGKLVRGFLDKVPAGEMPPHIAKLDINKLLGDIGLDGIEAIGMSSYRNGELFHNRAFIYIPEGRNGALKVFGGDSAPFVSSTLAPADSDLVFEQTIDIAAVYEMVSKVVMHVGGEEGYAEFRREMSQMNRQMGLSMADLFSKLDTRVTLVGRIHPDKPLNIPDAPIDVPSFDALIALDDLGWLFEKMTAKMKEEMPAEQVAQMFVMGDGIETIALPPMPTPDMMIMQPVIVHHKASKRIYLASSQAYLDECLAGKSKLVDNADFKRANAGLPAEGNGRSYVSGEVMKTIGELYSEAINAAGGQAGGRETMMFTMMKMLIPDVDVAQAKVSVNQKDGIFVSSNSTMSVKEGAIMGGASTMATMAGLTFSKNASKSVVVPQEAFAEPRVSELPSAAEDAVEEVSEAE